MDRKISGSKMTLSDLLAHFSLPPEEARAIFSQVDWLEYSVIDKIVKAMAVLPLVLFDPSR